jgi:hypothetical protein
MRGTDWVAWHQGYDDPDSRFSLRLRLVQDHIRAVLDRAPDGPIRVLVPCAGQGRDLLGVLADHPRRGDVTATLIERDRRNVEMARAAAQALGVAAVTVVRADAGRTDAYVGAVPASVIVLSGFFDYLTTEDLARLIRLLPQLCARGATVVWTRRTNATTHPHPSIRAQFEDAEFRAVTVGLAEDPVVHVGVERFEGAPLPLTTGARLFSFRDPRRSSVTGTLRRALHGVARRLRRFV